MGKLPSLEKIKEGIRAKIVLENVTAQSDGNTKKLHNAMAVVPEGEMWRVVQWMHEILLPKIAQSRGVDSTEYKNYIAGRDAIIWALYMVGAYEKKLRDYSNEKFLTEMYRDRMLYYEQELLKYTTAEQLLQGEALQAYRVGIVANALQLLEENKQKTEP